MKTNKMCKVCKQFSGKMNVCKECKKEFPFVATIRPQGAVRGGPPFDRKKLREANK